MAQTEHIFMSLWNTEGCYSFLFCNSLSHRKDFAFSAFFFSSRLTKPMRLLLLVWIGFSGAQVLPLATSPSPQSPGPRHVLAVSPKEIRIPPPFPSRKCHQGLVERPVKMFHSFYGKPENKQHLSTRAKAECDVPFLYGCGSVKGF